MGQKMVSKLKKYALDPLLSYEYLCDNLKGTNELSSKILEIINLKEGEFFTFLHKDIKNNQLYQFKYGGVTNAQEICDRTENLVFNLIKNYPEISAIFDSFNCQFRKDSDEPFFLKYGFHYSKEVYYIIDDKIACRENIKDCFNVSDAIWHSLCVLSKIKLNLENREFTKEHIDEICLNAQIVLVGAYDDESYVFWKRNDFVIDELVDEHFTRLEDLK